MANSYDFSILPEISFSLFSFQDFLYLGEEEAGEETVGRFPRSAAWAPLKLASSERPEHSETTEDWRRLICGEQ